MSAHDHHHPHGSEAPAAPAKAEPRTQFSVSDKAAGKLKELLEQEKKGPEFGLRIGVQGGGCSGLSYFMDFDTQQPNDRTFEDSARSVKIFIDPKSLLYMSGSILDYAEGLMGSGFTIKNPQVKGSCGCGSSFNV